MSWGISVLLSPESSTYCRPLPVLALAESRRHGHGSDLQDFTALQTGENQLTWGSARKQSAEAQVLSAWKEVVRPQRGLQPFPVSLKILQVSVMQDLSEPLKCEWEFQILGDRTENAGFPYFSDHRILSL